MNFTELKMVEVLKELNNSYSVVGVKAEFEAEGTRTEELMRLKEICMTAKIPLTLKIGGCEAVRDMYDARSIGINHLVAPMVETKFALQKYLNAIDIVFTKDEQKDIEFLVNIETIQAVNNFDDMLTCDEIGKLDGIVIGRSDLVGSMGLTKKAVDSPKILELTKNILNKAKMKNMTCVIGGTISVRSIPFLRELSDSLDRYETRKVCFACSDALRSDPAAGINMALDFEFLWLQNKQDYYKSISEEDQIRLSTLKERGKGPIK